MKQERDRTRRGVENVNDMNSDLGSGKNQVVFHDMDDLAGTWVDDEEFDRAIRFSETVDEQSRQ